MASHLSPTHLGRQKHWLRNEERRHDIIADDSYNHHIFKGNLLCMIFGTEFGRLSNHLSSFCLPCDLSFFFFFFLSKENQSILASWCSSLLSKGFTRIKRFSLVSSDMKWSLRITYDLYRMSSLKTLLMVHSGTLRFPQMALIHFPGFLSIIFCTFRSRLGVLMELGHLAWILRLAAAIEPPSAVSSLFW